MAETALTVQPKASVTFGGRALTEVADSELVDKSIQSVVDRFVLRAESIEIIGNDKVATVANSLVADINKFLRDRTAQARAELEPYESAVTRIKTAHSNLVQPLVDAKLRIKVLLDGFAAELRRRQAAIERAQQEEAARIRKEAARLEEEKRLAAEATALAAASSVITEDEKKALEERQQALSLETAALNRQVEQASKAVEVPKIEGMGIQEKWTHRFLGDTDEAKSASMLLAFKEHPEWFDISPKKRVIDAAAKEAGGKITCAGMEFYLETKSTNR